jgi:hypothetical protein
MDTRKKLGYAYAVIGFAALVLLLTFFVVYYFLFAVRPQP